MTSQISSNYRRQILHPGDIFSIKDVDSCSPSPEYPEFEVTTNNSTTVKRRRVHIDYDEVFGDIDLPEEWKAEVAIHRAPSPKYEQTVQGLTDESLEYFPERRRGCYRITAKIIKNLTSEFDQLADEADVTEQETETEETKYLQVPTYNSNPKYDTKWDEIKARFSIDKSKDNEEDGSMSLKLRRKPIKLPETETSEEDESLKCTIC